MNQKLAEALYNPPVNDPIPDFFKKMLSIAIDGLILEFGATNAIHNTFKSLCEAELSRKVYGFDWFQGLPEDWVLGVKKGAFKGRMMGEGELPGNGEYVIGLIQDTLEPFLEQHPEPLAFAHLDMDLYSSTKFALDALIPRCRPGTILAFDEIIGDVFEDHEYKAFSEFLDKTNYNIEMLGCRIYCSAAFRLKS